MNVLGLLTRYKENGYLPVGKGWHPIVLKLIKDIAKIAPDTEVSQIKEKFGTLRFYCQGDGGDAIGDLIEKAEQESGVTCEVCGTKEGVTTKSATKTGWILTLCKPCRRSKK